MLPLRVRVDLGAMAMKGYSTFPKTPALLESLIRVFSIISRTFVGRSYSSTEMQSMYSLARADWDEKRKTYIYIYVFIYIYIYIYMCVCVCVCVRARVCVCVCVRAHACVRVWFLTQNNKTVLNNLYKHVHEIHIQRSFNK